MRMSRGMGAVSKPKLRAIGKPVKKFKGGDKVVEPGEPIGYGGMPYDELIGVYSYPSPSTTKRKKKKYVPPPEKEPSAEYLMDLPPMPRGMSAGGVTKKKPRTVVKRDGKKPVKLMSGGSKVNAAGNYTKPALRKKIVAQVKAAATHGTAAGQWSARKAQLVAKKYKAAGGGYRG